MTGNHSLLREQHKCLNNVFGTIWQEISPYTGNNTSVWIMYLGLYERKWLPTLGTTQVYEYNIWDYMPGNHSLLWEQHRYLDYLFGTIWQVITPYTGNNTSVWIMYLGRYDKVSLPTLGNNTSVWIMYLALYDWDSLTILGNKTGVWIMYLGLYERETLRTLGTTQVSCTVFGTTWFGNIWQVITPYSGNNTGVWIIYLGLYDRESLRTLGTTQVSLYNIWDYVTGYTLGNNTGVWIMYLGIYEMESLPSLGNNTGVWIMYTGLYDRESLPTLGNNTGVWIMYLG